MPICTVTGLPPMSRVILSLTFQPSEPVENSLGLAWYSRSPIRTVSGLAWVRNSARLMGQFVFLAMTVFLVREPLARPRGRTAGPGPGAPPGRSAASYHAPIGVGQGRLP